MKIPFPYILSGLSGAGDPVEPDRHEPEILPPSPGPTLPQPGDPPAEPPVHDPPLTEPEPTPTKPIEPR